MRKILILLPLAATLFFFSCKRESTQNEAAITPETPLAADHLRTDFARILANAITDPQLRKLIQEEALQRFNNDYEVLYQLVKHKEVHPGIRFEDILASHGMTAAMQQQINEKLPLLTFLVPTLKNFSAQHWKTDSQVPLVAVVNSSHNESKRTPVVAFDHLGQQLQLSRTPEVPVIVVKDNERITARPKSDPASRADNSNLVFANSTNDFYFTGDHFNRKKVKIDPVTESARFDVPPLWFGISPLTTAHTFKYPSQRDYTYYGIRGPAEQGALRINYAEYLTGIVFDPNSAYYLFDDEYTDWVDGMFEFQLDVLLFNGSSTLNKISKVFAVPADGQYFTSSTTTWYSFANPIMIATWDMKKYGDTWKYVLNELDAGTVTTITYSASTKIGSNFSYNSSTGEEYKVGTGFGTSIEQSFTNSIAIQITQGSDFCGEAVVNFMSPVIIGPPYVRGQTITSYQVADVNTGIARMLIYPRAIN